jgi:hypothetical protein
MNKTVKYPSHRATTSNRKWIVLIILPFVLLIATALFQMVVGFLSSKSSSDTAIVAEPIKLNDSPLTAIVNIFSLFIGIVAVVLLVLIPVWIIRLVSVKHNKVGNRSKAVAVLLAVLSGFFTWLYTYEKDSVKFWLNLALFIITLTIWGIVAWIWAVIDTATKPSEFYENYGRK